MADRGNLRGCEEEQEPALGTRLNCRCKNEGKQLRVVHHIFRVHKVNLLALTMYQPFRLRLSSSFHPLCFTSDALLQLKM